jgi:hypothetical protein
MVDIEFLGFINPAECKGRAGNVDLAARAGCQAADKGRFTAAEVGAQFDNFAAFKIPAQQAAEPFGFGGICR